MIDLFQIARSDQSVYYLGQIFGYVGNVLPADNPSLLVGILFKTLNTTALTIGAFMVVYVTVVGLLKTAQEGEFLGRQWNSLWVPIRTVLGIAALFPTATGYSAIQVIIMWVILQGVGAADTLWGKALEYITVAGSPYASISADTLPMADVQQNMKGLFQSLICQASAKATYPDLNTPDNGQGEKTFRYYCGNPANKLDPFCLRGDSDMLNPIEGPQANATASMYNMGPGGTSGCGSLTYCDVNAACKSSPATLASGGTKPESNAACLVCKAQQAALTTIVPTLGAIATKFVDIDYQYLQFKNFPVSEGSPAPVWIQDFCTANDIGSDRCCGVMPKPTSPMELFSQMSATAKGEGCAPKFPPDSSKSSDGDASSPDSQQKPPTQAERTAVELYLKYPIAKFLDDPDANFMEASMREYTTSIVNAVAKDIEGQMEKTTLTDWQKAANDNGWILAGGFFYKIASMNSSNQMAAKPVFSAAPMSTDSGMNNYRNNYQAAGGMLNMMLSSTSSVGFANTPGLTSDISSALGTTTSGLLSMWKGFLGGNSTNPLVAMASFGSSLMLVTQILFIVVTAAVVIATSLATINPMVLGTGITMNPFGEGVKALVGFLGPFFVMLIGALFSLGAILGIYVPLIPYMIFTIGAIGWLIATIEAMVAGPIIALGILSPGGQHDILGRAEPALMQLFNLFLRPSLMILGLMISMLLSVVVVKLVNAGFLAVSSQLLDAMSGPGLVEQIIFIAAYTSFIITALNKAFSLIYVVPERVLTWIGGPAVQYGEQEALHATKQAVESAAGATTGAAKESAASAQGAGTAMKQAGMAAKDRAEKAEAKALLKQQAEKGGSGSSDASKGGGPPGGPKIE